MRFFDKGKAVALIGEIGVVYHENPTTVPEESLALIFSFLDDETVWKLFALHTAVSKAIINSVFEYDYSDLSGGDSRSFYIQLLLAINRPAVYLEMYDRRVRKNSKKALKRYAAKSEETSLSLESKTIILDKYKLAHKFYKYIKNYNYRWKSNNKSILESPLEDMFELLLPTIEKQENVLPTLQEFVCDSKRFKLFRQLARTTYYRDNYETPFYYALKEDDISLDNPQRLFNVLLHCFSTHDISRLVMQKDQNGGSVSMEPLLIKALELASELPYANKHQDLLNSLEITKWFAQDFGNDSTYAIEVLRTFTKNKPLAVPINIAGGRLHEHCDFSELQLLRVIFSGAHFTSANFSNCNLWGSDFEEVVCTETRFNGSNMENSNVKNFSAGPFEMIFLIVAISKNGSSTEQIKRSLDNFKRFLPCLNEKHFQEVQKLISYVLKTNKPKLKLTNSAKCSVLHKNAPDRMNRTPYGFLLDAQKALTEEREARAKPPKNTLNCALM